MLNQPDQRLADRHRTGTPAVGVTWHPSDVVHSVGRAPGRTTRKPALDFRPSARPTGPHGGEPATIQGELTATTVGQVCSSGSTDAVSLDRWTADTGTSSRNARATSWWWECQNSSSSLSVMALKAPAQAPRTAAAARVRRVQRRRRWTGVVDIGVLPLTWWTRRGAGSGRYRP